MFGSLLCSAVCSHGVWHMRCYSLYVDSHKGCCWHRYAACSPSTSADFAGGNNGGMGHTTAATWASASCCVASWQGAWSRRCWGRLLVRYGRGARGEPSLTASRPPARTLPRAPHTPLRYALGCARVCPAPQRCCQHLLYVVCRRAVRQQWRRGRRHCADLSLPFLGREGPRTVRYLSPTLYPPSTGEWGPLM